MVSLLGAGARREIPWEKGLLWYSISVVLHGGMRPDILTEEERLKFALFCVVCFDYMMNWVEVRSSMREYGEVESRY